MIQLMTNVNIIDNSGGSLGRCIKVLHPHNRNYAKIGDIILVSIKETVKLSPGSIKKGSSLKGSPKGGGDNKITKGSMFKALVVRTKVNYFNSAKFDDNAVILLKSNLGSRSSKGALDITPLGSRIKGPISSLFFLNNSGNKYQKILSLSKLHF